MRSTMQETPLSIATLVRYGTTVHGSSEVLTWTGDGVRSATYAEVGRRAAQLAHALRELGVRGDDRVATLMWNNQEHLEAYLAVPAMGAVLHPLNLRLFPDQLAFIADHAADKVVLVDGSVLPVLAKVLGQLSAVEHVVVNGPADLSVLDGTHATVHAYEELLHGRPEEFDWVEVAENDAAAMCYTSGTTGNPKGVVYSHRSIYLHSMQVCMPDGFGMRQADRVLLIVPMFHVLAWGTPYAALMSGASLVMPDRFLTPEPLADLIETARPTLAGGVPTIWTGLLALLDETPRDMSSLRDVIVGGSACPRSLMEGLEQRHGVHVTHAWGMTETSPLGSISRAPAGVEGEDAWRYRLTQGRLAASVEARLTGPDGTLVANDGTAVGELEVRGPWIAASYYRDDDPAKFHDGWLRTGDVGTHQPGRLPHADRPVQGRDQVRRRVDLVGRAGERADGAPGGRRGLGGRRTGREVGRAAARHRRRQGRRGRDGRGAARLPRRAGRGLAAAGAVVVRRRGAQDLGRQVRQEGHPAPVRRRRPRRPDPPLTPHVDHAGVINGRWAR